MKTQLREREITAAESISEILTLKRDLEDARSEQHRLDDEVSILQNEIERLKDQIRDNDKSRFESQMLAEGEVAPSANTINNKSATAPVRRE